MLGADFPDLLAFKCSCFQTDLMGLIEPTSQVEAMPWKKYSGCVKSRKIGISSRIVNYPLEAPPKTGQGIVASLSASTYFPSQLIGDKKKPINVGIKFVAAAPRWP